MCLIIESANCIDTVCQYIAVTLANPCNNLAEVINPVGPPPQTSLSAIVTGGTQPYTYSWNNGSTNQLINVTSSMNYCVTASDAIGCTSTTCYNYISNCILIATIVEDTSANTLTAVATLGVLPYTFQWSNDDTQILIN